MRLYRAVSPNVVARFLFFGAKYALYFDLIAKHPYLCSANLIQSGESSQLLFLGILKVRLPLGGLNAPGLSSLLTV